MRAQLVDHERLIEDFRTREAELRTRLDHAQLASPATRTLQPDLDEHRAALADARAQNHRLIEQLESATRTLAETERPTRRRVPIFALAAAAIVAIAASVGLIRLFPGEDAARKNAEILERLKQQNSALAGELNNTLLRLQSVKETELSLDRNRSLNDRLTSAEQRAAELERQSPINLARITQLQSDLDLATARMQKLFTELSMRDLKIMELEALLGEAGSEAFQMNLPPALSLDSPTMPQVMFGGTGHSSADPNSETAPVIDPLKQTQAQAEQAYKDKNYALAEVLFQRVSTATPRNNLALSNLAAVQLELGKYSAAESSIRRALAISPEDAFSLTTLGIIQIKIGQVDAAIQTLLHAIALDATDPASFNYLGVAYGEKGDRTRAIEEIRKAANLSPDYLEAQFNLAVLHSQGGPSEKPLSKNTTPKPLNSAQPQIAIWKNF